MEAGGIAGMNDGLIEDCSEKDGRGNYGTVESSYMVGGVAGVNTGEITDCSNSGLVRTGWGCSGGVCGINLNGEIRDSSNSSLVTGRGPVGGVAGINSFLRCLSIILQLQQ